MLDEENIRRMTAYDLSTFRLWLFSKEWRLLNKQIIPIAGAFDATGKFQPSRALVSRRGRELYAVFEISPADWQAAHNLLITGRFLRGSEHSVDFEVVVSKSQLKPLKSPPALGQTRLPDAPNHWRKSCRWRWWVLHSPPQRSWDSGWQMGAWSYDQLVGSNPHRRVVHTGWSQLLLWHESDLLQEALCTIRLSPIGDVEWSGETTDRDASFVIAHSTTIEMLALNHEYHQFHYAGGVAHKTSTRSITFSINPDEYLNPKALPSEKCSLERYAEIDSGIPRRGREPVLRGTSFHWKGSGMFSLTKDGIDEIALYTPFCLVRVHTHLLLETATRRPARQAGAHRFSVYCAEPLTLLHAEAYHDSRHCHIALDF